MKNLTPPQKDIIDKMNQGWELTWHLSTSAGGYYTIQKESTELNKRQFEWVKKSTVNYLVRRGLIMVHKKIWNCNFYKLV